MTSLLVCLFIAMLLPYAAKLPVGYAMAKAPAPTENDAEKSAGYDNHHPRAQQARLMGMGARAVAAHQNAFESLLIFGLAVLAVIATGKVSETSVTYAIVYLVARIAYNAFYLLDWSNLRSTSWFVAIYCSFAILWQAF